MGCVLILAGATAAQVAVGYTPAGGEFWRRGTEAWPGVTAHAALLDRFLAQIPRGAAAAATTDLFPHLSHRQLLYQFPDLGQAQWALVDVAGVTDRHPQAIKDRINQMLAQGWGVVDAADGYILLRQGQGHAGLTEAFYDFARSGNGQPDRPQHALDISFGGKLKLAGYDVLDDRKWRRTVLRFYWRALEPLPSGLQIHIQAIAPDGSPAADTDQTPMVALLWYPPERWQPGETVTTQGAPWYLPAAWAPLIQVTAGEQPWPATGCQAAPDPFVSTHCLPDGGWLGAAIHRAAGDLSALPRTAAPATKADALFAGPDWQVSLRERSLPAKAAPGGTLPVTLMWADWPGAAGRDYTVFLHLRDATGRTIAGADATPTFYAPMPTTRWPGSGSVGRESAWDGSDVHSLILSPDLAEGMYSLVAGWYDWQTGERLKLVDRQGNTLGDEYVLGSVKIDPASRPQPDLACLLAPPACTSQ